MHTALIIPVPKNAKCLLQGNLLKVEIQPGGLTKGVAILLFPISVFMHGAWWPRRPELMDKALYPFGLNGFEFMSDLMSQYLWWLIPA